MEAEVRGGGVDEERIEAKEIVRFRGDGGLIDEIRASLSEYDVVLNFIVGSVLIKIDSGIFIIVNGIVPNLVILTTDGDCRGPLIIIRIGDVDAENDVVVDQSVVCTGQYNAPYLARSPAIASHVMKTIVADNVAVRRVAFTIVDMDKGSRGIINVAVLYKIVGSGKVDPV